MPPRPLHVAARLEDRVQGALSARLHRRGWRPMIIGFTGYAADGWVRLLARVLLAPPGTSAGEVRLGRGWRRFLTIPAMEVELEVEVGGRTHRVTTTRDGYVDRVIEADLAPGWAEARLTVVAEAGSAPAAPTVASIRVVDPEARLGVLSDIDDTVIVTALPRPLLAAYNTFLRHEDRRRPVPGMAGLFGEVLAEHPGAPVIYLSTGPWNVAPVLRQFLDRHGYPAGPLLMTDWGPTSDRWFRSGREHKRRELRRLLADLPSLDWLLVGDDGQHDPQLYAEVVELAPDRVRAVAIRQLSTAEQVRTHATPDPLASGRRHSGVEVRAPDGQGLAEKLRERGVLGAV